MVFTTQKAFSQVLHALGKRKRWVVVGCAECAAICQTGGSAQVEEMVSRLEQAGKEVLASVSLASPCDRRLSRRDLKRVESELSQADGVLCLSCGGGVQAVAGLVSVPVLAGLDSQFVGTVERLGLYREECNLCGDCLLNDTAGLCPQTLCPKGLRNGPCEGSQSGKCESDPDLDCAWERIHRGLTEQGRDDPFGEVHPPPDPGRWGRPRASRKGGSP